MRSSVEKLHKRGNLFVHILESETDWADPKYSNLERMLDVMSCKEGSFFENQYRRVLCKPHGYTALSVTALKQGYPINTWGYGEGIGLLIDGEDRKNVKILTVSETDIVSRYFETQGEKMYMRKPYPILGSVWAAQGLVPDTDGILVDISDINQRDRLSRKALSEYWKGIEELGYDNYEKKLPRYVDSIFGMNELNITCKTGAFCGIVVPMDFSASLDKSITDKLNDICDAIALRQFLRENYSAHLTRNLDIFVYYKDSKEQLVKMDINVDFLDSMRGIIYTQARDDHRHKLTEYISVITKEEIYMQNQEMLQGGREL